MLGSNLVEKMGQTPKILQLKAIYEKSDKERGTRLSRGQHAGTPSIPEDAAVQSSKKDVQL